MTNNLCIYCKKVYSSSYVLSRHTNSCKELLRQKVYEITKEKDKLLEEKEHEIQFLREKVNKLETENTILKQTAEERKQNYDVLLDKFDRPNTNVVTYNKTTIKQIVSKLEPICFDKIKESMSLLKDEYIDDGINGFAKFLCDHSLNNRFITTDHSRNIIAYRTDFYDFIRDPECLTLINRTLKENYEEVVKKSTDRMEYYRKLMDTEDDEYLDCSDKAMKVYELKKFADASIKEKPDDNIKAISNILCKHGLDTYQNTIKSL